MNMKVEKDGIATNFYTADPFFKNEYHSQIQIIL